jgi:hypothetical protein
MKFQVINLPFCFMPGYERFLAGDLGKRSRHMVFVNNETVNLASTWPSAAPTPPPARRVRIARSAAASTSSTTCPSRRG